MKVAYFINHYPKVSHSFIRREIVALEKMGITVARYAVRTDTDELVDDNDKDELKKTKYLLDQSFGFFFKKLVIQLGLHPVRFLKTLGTAVRIGWNSDRGLARHVFYLFEACVLKDWLTKNDIEHLHVHFGNNSTSIAMLAYLLGGPKYSFTVHGPIEFDMPAFISLGEKIERANFVVAISSYCKSQMYRWIPHRLWEKVEVVHCGLDDAFMNIDVPGARQNRKLVCVGRLCEQKGQQLLIEAAGQLSKEGEEFELILVGDGPMRSDLELLIGALGLRDRVSITGWVSSDEVREQLMDCTALVLPSFAEGLPVVIMEAMALGRPVITTYIAGIPELVIAGENGWLVPAGSLESLVDAMRMSIKASDAEIQRLGEQGRKRVLERHNIDIEAAKLANLMSGQAT